MAHRRTEHYIILYYIALNLFTSYCNLGGGGGGGGGGIEGLFIST